RRADALVLVTGAGPLAGAIATTLDAAGVGRIATTTRDVRARIRAASLVVRVGADDRPPALVARAYAGVPHLAVAVRDAAVVVGPFVPPGGSPCPACLYLHRCDRDPVWPSLAEQLAAQAAAPAGCA